MNLLVLNDNKNSISNGLRKIDSILEKMNIDYKWDIQQVNTDGDCVVGERWAMFSGVPLLKFRVIRWKHKGKAEELRDRALVNNSDIIIVFGKGTNKRFKDIIKAAHKQKKIVKEIRK